VTAVAVLGTGRMGSAMARALARGGHDLVLYNRTESTARKLADELDARVATKPSAAVGEVDVALSMLADRGAVEDTYRAPDGAIEGVRDGTILLEMSTVEPEVARSLEPQVRARGGSMLDAPVSGSVALAEQGQLAVMVGGDPDALERARPVLESLAGRVFHLGPVGSGAAMKLAVNAVVFAIDVALSEALVLAERAGIDRSVAYDVLQASAVGSPLVGYKRASFLEPDTTPTGFSLELAAKDLRLITRLAEEVGLSARQARTNLDLIRAAAETEGGERDFALVASHLRARAGVATS
jgi:3-hydroxyisobutyrate dehydrogenase-like beta-hydroxyacid dehydrogenase